MSVATGARSGLAFKEETVYGTAPTGNWEQMTFNNESLLETINTIKSNEININRNVGTVRGGNISAGGSIQLDMHSAKLGLWLKHMISDTLISAAYTVSPLAASTYARGDWVSSAGNVHCCLVGGVVSSGDVTATLPSAVVGTIETLSATSWMVVGTTGAISANAKTHTITGAPGFPVGGISVEKQVIGGTNPFYLPFLGNRIKTATFTMPQEGICTIDLALLGLKGATPATTSIAGTPVIVPDDPFTGFQQEIKINSAINAVVQSGSLTIENNFDPNVFTTASRYRRDVVAGRREISGKFQMVFEDMTQYTLFKNETKVPIFISLIHEGKYMSIDMPECKFTGGQPTPAIAGNGTVTSSFEFMPYQDTGSYDIKFILRNIIASF